LPRTSRIGEDWRGYACGSLLGPPPSIRGGGAVPARWNRPAFANVGGGTAPGDDSPCWWESRSSPLRTNLRLYARG
jgi:hypothetical protein